MIRQTSLLLFTLVTVFGCDLSKEPCVTTLDECRYPIIPNSQSIRFTPYPVCLPKGRCDETGAFRSPDGLLHTFQTMSYFITDTSQFQFKRLHARSTLRVGKNLFPKCITPKFFNRGQGPSVTKFAYGTCDLDTIPTTDDDGDLCDLLSHITTVDETGVQNVLRCSNGLVHFAPESVCSQAPQCAISISFDSKYREDGPVIYRPFRGATITVEVELYLTPSFEGDQSNLVQTGNEHCRQYLNFDKCVGYFTIVFNSSE